MRMILTAAAMTVVVGGTRAEEVIRPENRLIANAAYVLRGAGLYFSSRLEIVSTSRAVFTGFDDGPVLVAQLDKCTFAIKSKGSTGVQIDFSRLYQTYYFDRPNGRWRMVFPGEGPAYCLLNDGQKDDCYTSAKFNRSPTIDNREFVASVSFIFDSGCRVAVPPQLKPRF